MFDGVPRFDLDNLTVINESNPQTIHTWIKTVRDIVMFISARFQMTF